jgi:predicted nucleotidyltransferase component of viral defense system
MLNLKDILSFYPEKLHPFKKNILKEYLQYQILDIIFSSPYANKLAFLGGTAIRITQNSTRFSEDLDFDNLSTVSRDDFKKISGFIHRRLELDGYKVEIENITRGAFHCYIKFPGLLYTAGLSSHQQEKILIQIDAEPQNYKFNPEKFLLNKFGLFRYINATPAPTLLAQKICAFFQRKREKGRDFFDISFLMAKTEPDFKFLKLKLKIKSKAELIARLKEKAAAVNLKLLAKDVEPFLMEPDQKNRILQFREWLDTIPTT